MDIQKEFEKWSNSKVIAFGEELTWRNGQPTYEECWNACATLLANRVKELEAENEKLLMQLQEKHIADRCLLISDEVWANILNNRHKLFFEVKHLQQQLDEAVRIIKTIKENVIHYAVTEEEQHLAYKIEQFLSNLDKPKEK